MGGKSKQRVKNNARPSSSARSAELVGLTGFVGFAAHAELGMVPLVPGFSTLESVPESFDAKISSDYQLVFRKMTKKDPMTKKKGLQEFVDLVNKHSLEENKAVLPIWPRLYQILSNDPEHVVRELSQTALRTLVSKCKRTVAPFLKQLVPHWLISQFDNYAPAASIATQSFRETFSGNIDRTREVLLHCQTEIVEKAERILTFHTASTLSSGKGLEPEEAEQKYQRAVIGSLKMVSFFVEKTRDSSENGEKLCSLNSLTEKQKFWSFAGSKSLPIRSAWFEFIFQILQSPHYKTILASTKSKVITLSFQNIDHSDASIASYAWGCVLLGQDNYDDWHKTVKLQESILPKVYNLLRNGLNRNASIIGPNLLPFFSKLPPEIFPENSYIEFCRKFFSALKESITIENPYSMTELNAIIRSNFECLRYLSQKLNHTPERSSEQEILAFWLVKENLIPSIIWFLESKSTSVKCYFQETSALVVFWASYCDNLQYLLYSQLLETFWKCICENTIATVKNSDVSETYLEHLSVLLQNLSTTNPNFEKHKIKFSDENELQATNAKQDSNIDCKDISKNCKTIKIIEKSLKDHAVELGKLCIQVYHERKSIKYIKCIRHLTQLFSDIDFYKSLNTAGTTTATLADFKSLFENKHPDEETYELLVNIIFGILQHLQKNESFTYIRTNLLKDSRKNVKILVLQRILSYPFCNEAAIREIIGQPEISSLIIEIAREAITDNTKDKFNMLHKCFFQAETGEILINQITVDGILKIFCETPLEAAQKDVIDACGSFLAQIMPVFCSGNNASEEVKNLVFLYLFEITMKNLEGNDYISEDTLWEITTCWQDTLSSGDISMDKQLLQACCLIIEKYVNPQNLQPSFVNNMADSLSKLIICSTEHIKLKSDRLKKIDVIISSLFFSKELEPEMILKFEDLCNILEASKGLCSPGCNSLKENCLKSIYMLPIFKRALLNLTTLKKLICKVLPKTEETEEERSEEYCDINENLLTEWTDLTLHKIIEYLSIAAVGDSIVNNNLYPLTELTEEFILKLSETVKEIMSNDCDIISTLNEKLMEKASNERNVRYARIISFLVYRPYYARFEESSTIILEETLCNHFIEQGSFETYVCCLQYLLPNLSAKVITMQNPIMQFNPSDVWIKAVMFRCLIKNNFDNVSSNETKDKTIALAALHFITDVVERNQNNKEFLLYNTTVHEKQFCSIINIVEYINLFGELIEKFPYQMTLKNWDALRIGFSSWTLTVSKSLSNFSNPATFLFIARVFRLYEKLKKFINIEKQKSSTTTVINVVEEWENLFARDVDLVLYKVFYKLCDEYDNSIDPGCFSLLMEKVVSAVELLDYGFIYRANKELNRLEYLCNFLLKHLSNSPHSIRTCCAHILHQMTPYFVAEDILNLEKDSDAFGGLNQSPRFHFLHYFADYITHYSMPMCSYLNEFSFKLTEINEFSQIDRNEAMSYLLLWDCIIYACSNSPVSLRSIYTSWLHENRYEENFLHFLFRTMPLDILKNHDSKLMSNDIFKSLDYSQIKDPNISVEKCVCHMYTEILRKLPALVRKWWNACPSRQKTFVDKLTTNFVSSLISYEELKTIANRKEKHENMQVTVHNSTREVLAVYSIDEARMELVITLPPNYPLGAVKVECGKQIGGRSSSRNIGMQLSIFLTHQNGTICDGLTLWKGNLDKKFEGVEECYICYTVIHQDTCQLPKLSCKTCKKKFHGPCLYKWFTTSSKSTCPICRNVF